MELYQLRYFQAVAESGTLRDAAAQLAVSQSAISRAIAMVETELGVELFTRRGRVNELNRFGRQFLDASRAAQRGLDNAVGGVRALAGADRGTVALGFLHSLGAVTVPRLIRHYHERHPLARFDLRQRSGKMVIADLAAGVTDLCLSWPGACQAPEVTWHQLFSQRLFAVLHRDHRLAKRRRIRFEELSEDSFVALDGDHTLRMILDEACARHNISAAIDFEGTDIGTLRGLIGAGLGVGILPRAPTRHPDIVEVAVDDRHLVRPIAVGWMTDRYLPPSATAFRDAAIDAFARRGGKQPATQAVEA